MSRGHYTSIGADHKSLIGRGGHGGHGGGGHRGGGHWGGGRGGRGWGGSWPYYGGYGYGGYGYGLPYYYGYGGPSYYSSYALPAYDITDGGTVYPTGQSYFPSYSTSYARPFYGGGDVVLANRSPRFFMNRHRRRVHYMLGQDLD